MPSGLPSFLTLLSFPYCHGEIHISERITSHDKRAPCTRGGSVEVMGWGGGRGVYRCTSVIMARAARNHRSEVGRPLLSLLLGGRGDAARRRFA